jgi:Icc-related predicted phosphoesterase
VVALLALFLVPAPARELGPAHVSAKGHFGAPRTVLVVPPLGTISAETHLAPLRFEFTLDQIDLPELGRSISRASARAALVERLESGLRGMATALVLRLVIGGAILGTIGAVLVRGRHPDVAIAGALGGAIFVGLSLGLSALTFDVDAFDEPRFSGTLERAPQVIEVVNRVGSFSELSSRFSVAADRLSGLLTLVAEPGVDPEAAGSVAFLHISDVHSNPLGVAVARQLAEEFEVDAVIDTGDLTSFGSPLESSIGDLIDEIPVSYYFVPGNHDSVFNRRQIAAVESIRMLNREVHQIEGLEILGWPDPTFTASNEVSTAEGNEVRGLEAERVAEAVRQLEPDLLAVHDVRLADQSFGLVPLVLAGHTHERSLDEENGTIVMTVGSTGATGLGSFIVDSDLDYEAEIVYLQAGRPVVVDYIRFEGLQGDYEIQRRTLERQELTPIDVDTSPTE